VLWLYRQMMDSKYYVVKDCLHAPEDQHFCTHHKGNFESQKGKDINYVMSCGPRRFVHDKLLAVNVIRFVSAPGRV
jgi:hypothetical protein